MAKFKCTIVLPNGPGGAFSTTIDADNEFSARALIELQYGTRPFQISRVEDIAPQPFTTRSETFERGSEKNAQKTSVREGASGTSLIGALLLYAAFFLIIIGVEATVYVRDVIARSGISPQLVVSILVAAAVIAFSMLVARDKKDLSIKDAVSEPVVDLENHTFEYAPSTFHEHAVNQSGEDEEVLRALEVLGLDETADGETIDRQYKALLRRFHPDSNGGDRSFEKLLGRVIDAREILMEAGLVK